MYISPRSATFRNAAVSTVNGSVTLVILLIAPLGLAAVIINTLLVTVASFMVSTMADRIVLWLQPQQKAELTSTNESSKSKYLKRWRS